MLSSDLLARSALESAPDAMIIIDAGGAILFANRQVSVLFGYEHDEIVGQNIDCLLPERYRSRHAVHRQRYTDAVRVRPMGAGLELFAQRKDGTEFPVEISLSPIRDRERLLVAAAVRDTTERRRVETEIKEARKEADRANQAKSRFLATASHDLRQPLQALGLLNGALRRMAIDRESIDALAQQEQAIGAMSRLLNALLDISKLESGAIKPDITDFKIAGLFEELRAEFAGLAVSKGLQLTVEPTRDFVRSDPSLLGQILRNLLANSIKYTQRGQVQLRSRRAGLFVCVEVLDTGVGIPGDQLANIYEEFYQVGVSTSSSRDGYGLGLSIVQRIVKLLSLKIEVQSQLGSGSTFSLEIPVGAARGADGTRLAPAPVVANSPPVHRQHVLLVEDDPGVRKATRLFLTGEGFRVTTAASLEEALQRARDTRDFELIITDYHLDGSETGSAVISSVRQILGATLHAVLMTGDTSSAIRELDCDARLRVISKPVNPDELLALIRALLCS